MTKHILSAFLLAAALPMMAQTTSLQIEGTDGTKTLLDISNIKGIVFNETPEFTRARYLNKAVYAYSGTVGTYAIDFGTTQPDAKGMPEEVGGVLASLTFVAPASSNSVKAELPAGYYKVGNSSTLFSFVAEKSAMVVRTAAGDEGVTVSPIIDGSVDVRHTADGYDIMLELVSLSGEVANLRYMGPMNFNLAETNYLPFEEDVNLVLQGLQGYFYANWYYPFCDDATLQGYNGEFDQDNKFTHGYWLNMPIYMTKVENPQSISQPTVPDGTYTIETRRSPIGNTYVPFTIQAGTVAEVMAQYYNVGTWLTYVGEDGESRIAYIVDGTLTVSNGGKKFVLDGVAQNGVKVNITFAGITNIINKCDNEKTEPKRPWSTLEKNVELNFTSNTAAIFFKDEPSVVSDLQTYTLWVTDAEMNKGDYLQFQILTGENGLTDGTYTIAKTFKANTIFPGWLGYGGENYGAWYGDLNTTQGDGSQTTYAPLTEGTVTISTVGNKKKMVFNLVDDNNHKITGEFNGFMLDGDELANGVKRKSVSLVKRK